MVKIRKICVRVTERHLALPIELVLPTLKIYFHIVLQTGIWCLIFWLRFIQWIDEITYSNASNFKHKPLFLKFNYVLLTILQKQTLRIYQQTTFAFVLWLLPNYVLLENQFQGALCSTNVNALFVFHFSIMGLCPKQIHSVLN